MQDVQRYDRRTIILHWTTAVLVVALWGSAQVIDWFPRGWPRVDARSVHITMGVTLVAVLIWRVAHRLGDRRKHAAASLVHHYVWRDNVLRRMLPQRP